MGMTIIAHHERIPTPDRTPKSLVINFNLILAIREVHYTNETTWIVFMRPGLAVITTTTTESTQTSTRLIIGMDEIGVMSMRTMASGTRRSGDVMRIGRIWSTG